MGYERKKTAICEKQHIRGVAKFLLDEKVGINM